MVRESTEGASVGGGNTGDKMSTLEYLGMDLTKLVDEGKLDAFAGWQQQIEFVTKSLVSPTKYKYGVCLIGESDVGKTAIVEGIAQRIANGDVPETIQGENVKVIRLDMGHLVAGTNSREESLKKLMEEIKQGKKIILFMDELHTLIGGGVAEGAVAAANILKPALERGQLQCISAATPDEFRKHIDKDPILSGRLELVKVPEPSVDETIHILKAIRERYEIRHKIRYTDEALVAAAQLSYQYIRDHFLPDEAIYLIDRAGSRVQLRNMVGYVLRSMQHLEEARGLEKELKQITEQKNEANRIQDFKKASKLSYREMELTVQIANLMKPHTEIGKADSKAGDLGPIVTEIDIKYVVSARTSIPFEKMSSDKSDRLLKMEETLHTQLIKMEEVFHIRVIGQDEAVKAISRAVCRERSGLKNPNGPIASFIFSGPTGVEKSELAKALASYYFGSEDSFIHLDMREFRQRHTVSKLIGPPQGYFGYTEGGQLTEAVRCRPYTVVLFDAMEMAHPDVSNMMLQILEDGRLTDSKSGFVDFRNTVLIFTSNVGSNSIKKIWGTGFHPDYNEKDSSIYYNIKSLVTEELKQYFRPNFMSLLDEIIVFRPLGKSELKEIAYKIAMDVCERQLKKNIDLRVTKCFIARVVDQEYDPSYGERSLRRVITRHLEDSLAEKILTGEIIVGEGDFIVAVNDRLEGIEGIVRFYSFNGKYAIPGVLLKCFLYLCVLCLVLLIYPVLR